jgi:hypothetical protein
VPSEGRAESVRGPSVRYDVRRHYVFISLFISLLSCFMSVFPVWAAVACSALLCSVVISLTPEHRLDLHYLPEIH